MKTATQIGLSFPQSVLLSGDESYSIKIGKRQLARGKTRAFGVTSWILYAVLVALSPAALAQQQEKLHRIGYLASASGPSPFFEAFRQGMRDLGYIDGQNVAIDYRATEDRNQIASLATELLRLKVELIVTQGAATVVAKPIVTTTPVVFGFSGDPVEAGFVDSLARPSTNFTGMSFMALELAGKRIELLRETLPKLARLAIISTRTHPGEKKEFKETQEAAQQLKTELQYFPVTTTDDIDKAFGEIVKVRSDAVLTFPDAVTVARRAELADFARKRPASEHVRLEGIRRCRRFDVVRTQLDRLVSPACGVRR